MSSIFPVFSSEPGSCSVLETGFTPWDDASDLFSMFDSPVCPVEVNPGLEKTNSFPIQTKNNSNPGLEDKPFNQTGLNVFLPDKDERRKKRKRSNRESARRSRIKKQKHIEEVKSHLNQLTTKNRELVNRLRYVMHYCQRAKMENDRLRLEQQILHDKLLNFRQALVLRQVQQSSTCATCSCVDSTVVTVHQNPSMIRDHLI
ncbi:unnamed protein product [Eruca vesicaria subsp. sativa]|uniref:BZIP domain-containing protein n=1 Tax=Eruca vesicaria subsp. sativa TaxID=29727 RepID=A0ABC8KYQ5_ERUVS|nr:unnamed protein product [Eruca vesicaria subsp. sativa]